MPKISVVVPVYNVEKYLRECLDSIINQTLKDIEIICINDGSTDDSGKILEEYAQKDKRIKVITQENKGVSEARNKGIENALGKYIMFLDADDWYDISLCEKVSNKINETGADIICFAFNTIKNNTIEQNNINRISSLKLKQHRTDKIINNQIFVWDKAFKKEFIYESRIRFMKNLKCAEDLVFCLSLFYQNPKYAYIEEALYNYNKYRTGNATSNNINAIKNDLNSLVALTQTEMFKMQSMKIKKQTINHFISGSVSYYRQFRNSEYRETILSDIKMLITYVEGLLPNFHCYCLKNYRKLKKILWKSEKHWYFKIFDIQTND